MAARSASLEELLAQSDWVRGLALGLVRDEDLAGELVQSTWLAALEHPPRLERGEAGLRGWLGRVLRNAARQRFRSEARREVRERSTARAEAQTAEDVVSRVALQQRVVAAVMALDEPYRSTVLQRYFDELPSERMAELAGVSPAAVRKRLSRALDMLRARLDEHFGGERGVWCAALARLALRGGSEAATGSALATGLVTLGIVMGSKLKLAGVAALLTLVVGAGWMVRSNGVERDSESARAAEPEVALPVPEIARSTPLSNATAGATASTERVALEPAATAPALRFTGRVLDRSEAPIAGATVELYAPSPAGPDPEVRASGATDADGRFELAADAPESGALSARASAPGFISVSVHPVSTAREIELLLSPATELYGHVLDVQSGAALAGARVSHGRANSTMSDAAGRYRIGRLAADQDVTLVVSCDGYVTRDVKVRIPSAEPREFDLELERGVPRILEVFDRASGQPLAGLEVRRHSHEDPLAITDGQGRVEMRIAAGMQLTLHMSPPGYCSFRWVWDVESLAGLAPGVPHRVPMLGLAWIEGRVTDAEEVPIDGCVANSDESSVGLQLTDEEKLEHGLPGYVHYESRGAGESSVTDAEGNYALAVIPAARPLAVSFMHREYAWTRSAPVVLATPGARMRVDAVLAKGATVSGRALLNAAALAGSVRWEFDDLRGLGRVAEDGSYKLKNVPAGRVRVSVRSYQGDLMREKLLEVEAGAAYTLDFIWEQERASIAGRVTDESGRPLGERLVHASCHAKDGYVSFSVMTGDDGCYVLEVAPGGLYTVSVGSNLDRRVLEQVAPGSAGVDFALPAIGKLRLELVDAASGNPVRTLRSSRWELSWRTTGAGAFLDEHGTTPLTNVDVDGRLDIALPVGQVDLRFDFHEDGYLRAEVSGATVSSSTDPVPVRVELVRGVEVELGLRPATPGEELALAGHLLFLLEESRRDAVKGPFPAPGGPANHEIDGILMWLEDAALMRRMLALDEQKRALVRGLAPGRYVLRAIPDDLAFEPALIELGDEPRSTVELVWSVK